jgi:hypothetical protein
MKMAKQVDEVVEDRVVLISGDIAELVDEFMTTAKQLRLDKLTDRKLKRTIPVLKSILAELESVV